ncbi:BlaI/MecI/CopY family transcriptional regulator [Parahaliea aestuarii]|uniref:BlaI/MecI/CopY family transcriptional regulator n=1 Tax=Parahaliea aestuarii TaxID=1852021 RepID=A0A5C9A4Q9_9GAMM|nr:BlaI/MecI/CopY family transcriptional regulator [Parahaliea aestuarii]TXS95004.1 BlaI/MecI/CopY family transcriptional regulator [Parahaliea aestuarii]
MAQGGQQLSRRERQIMDLLYELGRASARDIHAALPSAPSYSAVRALLAILVDKGQVTFQQEGSRYIYAPAQPLTSARQGALRRLVKTFFGGSTHSAANALLGLGADDLADEELDELAALIERERARRRE